MQTNEVEYNKQGDHSFDRCFAPAWNINEIL